MLRLTFALLSLIVVVAGCSRLRGATMYVKNDGEKPVRVQLHRLEDWPRSANTAEQIGTSIIVFPHSNKGFDVRLVDKESYRLDVQDLQGRITGIPISQAVVAHAETGEIRVVLSGGAPRLTIAPDANTNRTKEGQAFLGYALQVVANLTALVFWAMYWRRRRTTA